MLNKLFVTQLLTALFVIFPSVLLAAELEIALSNETANIEYKGDSEMIGLDGADVETAVFYNDEDDFSLLAGLQTDGAPAGDQPFAFTLGARLYVVETDQPNASTQALALGAGFDYFIPANMPMMVGAKLYYAPQVTTLGDADNLLDFRAQFSVDLLPSASVFLGYRQYEVDLQATGTHGLDENIHIGLRFHF